MYYNAYLAMAFATEKRAGNSMTNEVARSFPHGLENCHYDEPISPLPQ